MPNPLFRTLITIAMESSKDLQELALAFMKNDRKAISDTKAVLYRLKVRIERIEYLLKHENE